jgi:ubiquinol-cytochrome c reductase iron-sulfur subunit
MSRLNDPTAVSALPAITRRNFLYVTTAAVGTVGIIAAVWPLIDQMNPDANIRAVGDIVELDLTDLRPAQRRVARWHHFPVFVVRRTAGMLASMQEKSFVERLRDPQSEQRQEPPSARNWYRSIDPAYAVLVGLCTACSCVPLYLAEASPPDFAGGFVCPCCASRYDPAGRVYSGLAQYNLPVPPYVIDRSRILIGKNMPGEIFTVKLI